MPTKDKRIWPLDLLKARRKMIALVTENVTESQVEDAYFSFAATDDNLPYYFIVREFDTDKSPHIYRVRYKPKSTVNPTEGTGSMNEYQLLTYFREWIKDVDGYVEQLEFEKDSIIEGYAEEFYEAFELVDEDAATHSYPLSVQLLLNTYFEKLAAQLEDYKETNDLTEAKRAEIDAIAQDVEELRETQTNLSKQKVLQKLSGIWAKMRKVGLKLLGEAKTEIVKEVIKQGVKGLLGNPQGPIDFVAGMLE